MMEYVILLIDDEIDMFILLKEFLEIYGFYQFKLFFAKNGREGIQKYNQLVQEKLTPNIVLMDIMMPIMDGFEATKEILKYYPDASIYFFTASARPDYESIALEIGCRGIIYKTTRFDKIVQEIINILSNKEK